MAGSGAGHRLALVSGSSRGLGAASAIALAARGYRVIVADVAALADTDRPELADVIDRFDHLDVGDFSQWAELVARLADEPGGLSALHLNAGVLSVGGLGKVADSMTLLNPNSLKRVVATNIEGVANGVVAMLPLLRRAHGDVVITASMAGVHGFANDPFYCMSKHAVVGLTRALGKPFAAEDMTTSVICPNTMGTPMISVESRGSLAMQSPDHVAAVAADLLERKREAGVWLLPIDGSIRHYHVQPLVETQDQAVPD